MVLGTLKGILVAIVLSLGALMSMANNPRVDELRRKPGTHVYRPRSAEHPEDEAIPGLLIVRMRNPRSVVDHPRGAPVGVALALL